MTSLTYNIQGVGVVSVAPDSTSEAVSNAYLAQIQVFADLYNQRLQNPTQNFTIQDYDQAQQAYQALVALSQNGLVVAGQSSPNTLTFQMAENQSLLFKTFDVNGLGAMFSGTNSTATDAQKIAALQGWWDLAPAGLANTINGALTAGADWESLQAMIELEYVQEGNNQISSALGGLQSALTATDSAVQFLTQLQNLYNDVTPGTAASISTNLGGLQSIAVQTSTVVLIALGPLTQRINITITISTNAPYTGDTFVHQFIQSGDGVFSGPITVTANVSDANKATFTSMIGQLSQLITSVMQTAGFDAQDIAGVLANPGGTNAYVPSASPASITANYSGSLSQELALVYNDMKNNAGGSLQTYIIDSQMPVTNPTTGLPETSPNAGNFGRNLSTAEVAAQSINTQQQQEVQQELYVFQEFYQSASGVLTSLTQIIQNMAQAAGQ